MLRQVAEGVLTHQSGFLQTNAVVVQDRVGVLLIDPGVRGDEMTCNRNDLREFGQPVVAGFSTHPHWDHLLWPASLGAAPRYGTSRSAATVRSRLFDAGAKSRGAGMIPPDIVEQVPLLEPEAALSGSPPTLYTGERLELLAALGHDARVASEPDASGASGEESVVLASFASRRGAEHMVASLGRGFREEHRKGHATALVISSNEDGSLELTQSRVLSASGVVYTGMRISLSVAMGFMGLLSSLRGAKGGIKEVRERGTHVGADEQKAHAILARGGPHAALVLVACDDHETRHAAAAKAAEHASESWDFSRTEFLADLDPSPKHDWVRTALGEPSRTNE